mmetsp:Transcript_19749/g.54385  ORF Transcript_19749/g.54385 Transcript_19749/m.54385 type:complete len:234 (+) Transcript_19749:2399-3100(+)
MLPTSRNLAPFRHHFLHMLHNQMRHCFFSITPLQHFFQSHWPDTCPRLQIGVCLCALFNFGNGVSDLCNHLIPSTDCSDFTFGPTAKHSFQHSIQNHGGSGCVLIKCFHYLVFLLTCEVLFAPPTIARGNLRLRQTLEKRRRYLSIFHDFRIQAITLESASFHGLPQTHKELHGTLCGKLHLFNYETMGRPELHRVDEFSGQLSIRHQFVKSLHMQIKVDRFISQLKQRTQMR